MSRFGKMGDPYASRFFRNVQVALSALLSITSDVLVHNNKKGGMGNAKSARAPRRAFQI